MSLQSHTTWQCYKQTQCHNFDQYQEMNESLEISLSIFFRLIVTMLSMAFFFVNYLNTTCIHKISLTLIHHSDNYSVMLGLEVPNLNQSLHSNHSHILNSFCYSQLISYVCSKTIITLSIAVRNLTRYQMCRIKLIKPNTQITQWRPSQDSVQESSA